MVTSLLLPRDSFNVELKQEGYAEVTSTTGAAELLVTFNVPSEYAPLLGTERQQSTTSVSAKMIKPNVA